MHPKRLGKYLKKLIKIEKLAFCFLLFALSR